ncbi:hypothetical protein ACFVGX_12735 [Streptomyces sp. NPDC127113]|uniref:hypothetical protein n=1 Tax=unclassified Streptomyces TaxID=2593676 RepID=UPI00362749D9
MPVIQVTAPSAGPDRDAARLTALCRAVAAELGLPDSGVVAVLAPAAVTVAGQASVAAWPLAVVHGSERPAAATDAALRALGRTLAAEWDVPHDVVWAEWSAGRLVPAAGTARG